MMLSFRSAVYCITAFALIVSPAFGQEPGWRESAEQEQSWTVRCGLKPADTIRSCRMVQTVLMKESRERLLTISVERKGDPLKPALLLHLPHGLFLPAGVSLSIDKGKATAMRIQTSDPDGAYAGRELGEPLLQSMKRGRMLQVSFLTAKRQQIAVPVSLAGFTAAFARLMMNEGFAPN